MSSATSVDATTIAFDLHDARRQRWRARNRRSRDSNHGSAPTMRALGGRRACLLHEVAPTAASGLGTGAFNQIGWRFSPTNR
jgi:hypothetical protein